MTSYLTETSVPRTAQSLAELLRETKAPGEKETHWGETEHWLARLVARVFLVQDSNSHPVFRLDSSRGPNQAGLETIGSGVFPVIGSFFNHSCSPNTIRVNAGRVNYLVAATTIKQGEEVRKKEIILILYLI